MTSHTVRRSLLAAGSAAVALVCGVCFAIAQNTAPQLGQAQPPAAAKQRPAPDRPAEKTELQKFMRAKLDAANLVLEGVVTERFKLIREGAEQLRKTSAADQWRVSNDALYRQHSREFARAVERLDEAARNKSIDGAALAWVETATSCIQCHKWVNAVLIAERSPQAPPPIAAEGRARVAATPVGSRRAAAASDSGRFPVGTAVRMTLTANEQDRVGRFMREKLASAQQVLEGLVTEEFGLVTKGTRQMILMSRAAEWQVFDTPEYREDSDEFRARCEQLLRDARDEKTSAAAMSYLQVTLSCVHCHKQLRQARVADADRQSPPGWETAVFSDRPSPRKAVRQRSGRACLLHRSRVPDAESPERTPGAAR